MPKRSKTKRVSRVDDDIEIDVRPSRRNQKKSNPDDVNYDKLKTPSNKHGCTDIICSIIFIVFIIGFIGLSIFSFINGKPQDLILPRDSRGQMCGKGNATDKPSLLFFDLVKCISVSSAFTGCSTPQICVEACPSENLYNAVPGHTEKLKAYCYTDQYTKKELCPTYVLESKPIFGRCIPDILVTTINKSAEFAIQVYNEQTNANETIEIQNDDGTKTDLTFETLKNAAKYLTNLFNLKRTFEYAYEDFENSVWLILAGLGIALVLSFLLILLLRFFVAPFVYVSIFAVLAIIAFGLYFCISYYLQLIKNNVNCF